MLSSSKCGRKQASLAVFSSILLSLFFFHIVARCRHWRLPRANREAKGLAALPRPPGRGAGGSRRASLYGRRWRRE